MRTLNEEETKMKDEIEEVARSCGLSFGDIRYYVVNMDELMAISSQHGFIHMYPHWRFGMTFHQNERLQTHGKMRIFEQVINTEPAIAYILEYNTEYEKRLVTAHVMAHVDFFQNNYAFNETNRRMDDIFRHYDLKIKEMCENPMIGEDNVERFFELCYSIEDYVDPYSVRFKRNPAVADKREEEDLLKDLPQIITEREYMSEFINTEQFKKVLKDKREEALKAQEAFPRHPQYDLIGFIGEYCDRLKPWEKEILDIVRQEAYYFAPQIQTKIMNEGWATFWHTQILFEHNMVTDAGLSQGAGAHSRVVVKDPLEVNPYVLGYQLFSHIKDRWDKGRHGLEYDLEKDVEKRKMWDTKGGKGMEKIMEIRNNFTDTEFIRQFLTQDFVDDYQFYKYELDPEDNMVKIASRDAGLIKEQLLDAYTNKGRPVIAIADANYNNKRELLMYHVFDKHEISYEQRSETLLSIFHLWRRPVHLLTPIGDKMFEFSCYNEDPSKIQRKEVKGASLMKLDEK